MRTLEKIKDWAISSQAAYVRFTPSRKSTILTLGMWKVQRLESDERIMTQTAPDTRKRKDYAGIYLIINLLDSKVYVGSSRKVLGRIKAHKKGLAEQKHINTHLQHAWNKYKAENFEFEIVEECGEEKLLIREQAWIEQFQSQNSDFGYNLAYPVKGQAPHPVMSQVQVASWKATKNKIKRAGWDISEEEYQKRIAHLIDPNGNRSIISDTMTALWKDGKYRAKRIEGLNRGRAKTNAREDQSKRNAALAQGRLTAIARSKLPESRVKQGANAIAQFQDPKIKAIRLEALARGRAKQKARAEARRAGKDIV